MFVCQIESGCLSSCFKTSPTHFPYLGPATGHKTGWLYSESCLKWSQARQARVASPALVHTGQQLSQTDWGPITARHCLRHSAALDQSGPSAAGSLQARPDWGNGGTRRLFSSSYSHPAPGTQHWSGIRVLCVFLETGWETIWKPFISE